MASKRSVPSKLCIRCNQVLPLTSFYTNKGWADQSYHDVWCRECADKYCQTKEDVIQYCYENNRQWKDSFWDSAEKKAKYFLSSDAEYLSPKTSNKRKLEIASKAAVKQFFTMMNMIGFYYFVDNVNKKDFTDGIQACDEDNEKPIYSKKWKGYFTESDIEALDDLYKEYEQDFVLDNVSLRDYAKKVIKASLNADRAEDKMRRGVISAGEYKEAQKIFDDLSKSSNFAACRRKPGESTGLGSLGEVVYRIENSGKLKIDGWKWEQDSVDKCVQDYLHTLKAAGVDSNV